MPKLPKLDWGVLPPTPRQLIAIARLCVILGEKYPLEDMVSNRREARRAMYELRMRRKTRRR